jgi:hypothetical protein
MCGSRKWRKVVHRLPQATNSSDQKQLKLSLVVAECAYVYAKCAARMLAT